ncbi:YT521-B-like domain-containing protein [Roridomyces roridus]|uniref:YT521-B-like domain-containing protein n=1 Tax=Roridomyces roridus TaxID=1738132 RepID=A0AAD7FXX2_9AGAR|nr:YT521-B-like domain-containing protein [Roridomyces roridus]
MYSPYDVYQQTSPYGPHPSPQHDGEKHQSQLQQPQKSSPYELGAVRQRNPSPAPDWPPNQQHYRSSSTKHTRASAHLASPSRWPPALSKPLVRRPYHPNPPAHRSDWVMWAGNVPSDAGHDELWRFFTAAPPSSTVLSTTASTSSQRDTTAFAGTEVFSPSSVLSIFPISRSSCAFINYDAESTLQAAIARFNGLPLRPADSRCAKLVCRARRRVDDLRAGVGGQRGMGMHMKYVREKAAAKSIGRGREEWGNGAGTNDESNETGALHLGALSLCDEQPTRPGSANSGGGSHVSGASTNSSLLTHHFPQRFFILKSLTRDDLALSVRTGMWATQRHNEGVLDRAFRTAKDVFLVFSVNKSGEFYGYARMSGPVGQESVSTGSRAAWAVRSTSGPPTSPTTGRAPPSATSSHSVPHGDSSPVHQISQQRSPLLSATHSVHESPAPLWGTSSTVPGANGRISGHANTAPAAFGRLQRGFSGVDARSSHSHDGYSRRPPAGPQIELDEKAPFRAMRNVQEGMEELGRVPEEEQGKGQNFPLQWLCTQRLPFTRTRHIRNPWNHDKEVKVSRDGTELEPGVGQALLEKF